MTEPEKGFIKDRDGWTWFLDPANKGWTLLHHETMLCYVGLPFQKVESEYGPVRPLTKYEQIYFRI